MEDGPKVNALAIVSLILGLAAVLLILMGTFAYRDYGLLCIPGIAVGSIAGIAGSVASRQIRRSEGRQEGSEIALVGQILGVGSVLLFLAVWSYIVFFGEGFSL